MTAHTSELCRRCIRDCNLRSERIRYCDSFTRADGLGIREEKASDHRRNPLPAPSIRPPTQSF